MRKARLGKSKVEAVPPQDHASRSSSWKEKGAAYQAVLGLTVMKTSCYSRAGSKGQLGGWKSRDFDVQFSVLAIQYYNTFDP